MNFEYLHIDQLIDVRELHRDRKNWKTCDEIRDYLDTKHVFIFDTPEGQIVYNQTKGTRQDIVNKINSDKKYNAMFDAWLVSMKESCKASEEKKRKGRMEDKPIEIYCKCGVCGKTKGIESMIYYKHDILDRDYFPEVESMCSYKCVRKALNVLLDKSYVPYSKKSDYGWIKRNVFNLSPLNYSNIKTEEIIFLTGILLD